MKELKERIKRSGKTYTEIAYILGITYVSLNNKLSGKNKFTVNEMFELMDLLNLDLQDLIRMFRS